MIEKILNGINSFTDMLVEKLKLDVVFNFISDLLKLNNMYYGAYVFYGAVLVLLILIIVIISASTKKHKKAKNALKETAKVEEVKEEKVEEPKVEEVKVEEVKAEEVKEEPKVEEIKAEEVKVEEVKTEEPKKEKVNEKPKATKKAPAKKTTKKVVKKETRQLEGKYTISQELENYRFRLLASNGELMVVSELYSSEDSCKKGIDTIKKNATIENIDYVQDKHGLFSFRVMTKQGRCLAVSANYKTEERAKAASESFIKFAITDKIINDESSDHFEIEEFKEEVETASQGKFKVVANEDGFVYQLLASNGRVIGTSQSYSSKDSCIEAIEKFRVAAYEGNFYIFKDKNGMYQFKLYNKQKRLVMAGEVYEYKKNAISVITSIKRFAKLAELVD